MSKLAKPCWRKENESSRRLPKPRKTSTARRPKSRLKVATLNRRNWKRRKKLERSRASATKPSKRETLKNWGLKNLKSKWSWDRRKTEIWALNIPNRSKSGKIKLQKPISNSKLRKKTTQLSENSKESSFKWRNYSRTILNTNKQMKN